MKDTLKQKIGGVIFWTAVFATTYLIHTFGLNK